MRCQVRPDSRQGLVCGCTTRTAIAENTGQMKAIAYRTQAFQQDVTLAKLIALSCTCCLPRVPCSCSQPGWSAGQLASAQATFQPVFCGTVLGGRLSAPLNPSQRQRFRAGSPWPPAKQNPSVQQPFKVQLDRANTTQRSRWCVVDNRSHLRPQMDPSVPASHLQKCAMCDKGRLSLGLYNICMANSGRKQTTTHATWTTEKDCTCHLAARSAC